MPFADNTCQALVSHTFFCPYKSNCFLEPPHCVRSTPFPRQYFNKITIPTA